MISGNYFGVDQYPRNRGSYDRKNAETEAATTTKPQPKHPERHNQQNSPHTAPLKAAQAGSRILGPQKPPKSLEGLQGRETKKPPVSVKKRTVYR